MEASPENGSGATPTDALDEMRASVDAYLKRQEDRLQELEIQSEQRQRAAVEAVIAETHAAIDRGNEPGAWTRATSSLQAARESARQRREDPGPAEASHFEPEKARLQRRRPRWRRRAPITDWTETEAADR
jgi:hypothetical protein